MTRAVPFAQLERPLSVPGAVAGPTTRSGRFSVVTEHRGDIGPPRLAALAPGSPLLARDDLDLVRDADGAARRRDVCECSVGLVLVIDLARQPRRTEMPKAADGSAQSYDPAVTEDGDFGGEG